MNGMRRLIGKRAAATLAAVSGFALAVAISLPAWHFVERQRSADEQARVGTMLARQLATDAEEPLLRQDRVSLGVVVKRLASREIVRHAAIFAADGQPLAVAGESPAPNVVVYSEPLVLADTVAAEARLTLVADSFAMSLFGMLAIAWPFWIGGGAFTLVAFLFGGTVAAWWHGPAIKAEGEPPAMDPMLPGPEDDSSTGLVVANLFNRVELSPATSRRALEAAAALADRVGRIYGAVAVALPDTGAALIFAVPPGGDRHFNMACAALVLRRSLERCDVATDEAGHGVDAGALFRYAVDVVPGVVSANAERFSTSARDALALSSVARDGDILIGKAALGAMQGQDRLRLGDFTNLATHALPGVVVLGVCAEYETLLDDQAGRVAATPSR